MSGKWKRAALALVLVLGLSLAGCQKGSSGPAGGGIKRPETIESAELQFTHPVTGDTIAVFDRGAIVQAGSHADLVADATSLYHRLWQAQAQYYTKPAE